MTALPPLGNLFPGLEAVQAAYLRILPLEDSDPVLIRILGRMLIHAPNDNGRISVARSINQCTSSSGIIDVGEYYYQYFMKYFRTVANKPTPTPSNHPSRPSMDARRSAILNSVEQAPTSHSQAKDRALVRDNYRCQMTGRFDSKSWRRSAAVRELAHANPGMGVGAVECHHILPQHIGQPVTTNDPRRNNVATVWSVVQDFGGIPHDIVDGDKIHHLGNIMTMRADIHISLDRLEIWLEPIEGSANMYHVGRLGEGFTPEIPHVITLTTDTPLPLPDPRFLALHAACAKVIQMSGAAESIDSDLRDVEETKVLSQDGSSAKLLEKLLFGHTPYTGGGGEGVHVRTI